MSSTTKPRTKASRLSEAKAVDWLKSLEEETRQLIAESWKQALDADGEFADDFYARVFALAPEVVDLFPGDMSEQKQLLTATMSRAINMVGDPDALILLLKDSGVRHAHYGVEHGQFAIIGKALIATVRERAGETFGEQHHDVWMDFYAAMSTLMRKGLDEAKHN